MKTMNKVVTGMAPQRALPRRSATLLCGILLAGNGLVLVQGTTAAFAKEETHVMPKGQEMKGPQHLKPDTTDMPKEAHPMAKGGIMGAKKPDAGVKPTNTSAKLPDTGPMMSMPTAALAAGNGALGVSQQAGPFIVTLIASPQRGRTRFEARVSRDSAYVTDAQVNLSLTMPYHKHGGTSDRLADVDVNPFNGQYVGTAKLTMDGIYEARVDVESAGQKGTAVYRFKVGKKAVNAHLGMWHPAGKFEVRFTTEPATPQASENTFRVQVARDGQPVSGATVNLHLSMPGMRMAGAVVSVALSPSGNAYEGTANLIHAGDWQAHITVDANGAKGTSAYNFTASE